MDKKNFGKPYIHLKTDCYIQYIGIFLSPILISQVRLKGTDITQYPPNSLCYSS